MVEAVDTVETVSDLVLWAEKNLKENTIDGAEKEAVFLVSSLLKIKPSGLAASSKKKISSTELSVLKQWIDRRIGREPLQYILGEAEFWGLTFKVGPDVLIPRPETEHLVSEGIKILKGRPAPLILDLCTGSGCVAVSFAREFPGARVFAADISAPALAVARENAVINGVEERIRFFKGNLFGALAALSPEGFDLIVSNPPYVKSSEVKKLEPEISLYEPVTSLDGGKDGLDFITKIINEAPRYLKPDGVLLVEIGYGQSDAVRSIAGGIEGFKGFEIIRDYSGIERVFKAGTRPRLRMGSQ